MKPGRCQKCDCQFEEESNLELTYGKQYNTRNKDEQRKTVCIKEINI
jgi:hypothetical protein